MDYYIAGICILLLQKCVCKHAKGATGKVNGRWTDRDQGVAGAVLPKEDTLPLAQVCSGQG